jgi:hypothetical protein
MNRYQAQVYSHFYKLGQEAAAKAITPASKVNKVPTSKIPPQALFKAPLTVPTKPPKPNFIQNIQGLSAPIDPKVEAIVREVPTVYGLQVNIPF